MSNGDSGDAQAKLAAAVADASRPPEPSLWVRIVQMVFAGVSLGAALAVALILLLHGPPAPKEPEAESGSDASSNSSQPLSTWRSAVAVDYVQDPAPPSGEGGGAPPADTPGEPPDSPSDDAEEESGGGSEEEKEEGSGLDSLATLNEQAPWAFAIVALLVAAFLATGRSLNFNGTKKEA